MQYDRQHLSACLGDRGEVRSSVTSNQPFLTISIGYQCDHNVIIGLIRCNIDTVEGILLWAHPRASHYKWNEGSRIVRGDAVLNARGFFALEPL